MLGANNAWQTTTWTGLTSFSGNNVWTDGDNIYYSDGSKQYLYDKATHSWIKKEWWGCNNMLGKYIWTDGTNVYYSYERENYVLNKNKQ